MKAVIISLESWDDVWRRNQHLSVELVRQGFLSELWFVEPSRRTLRSALVRPVHPGIVAITPASPLPKSLGGLMHVGRQLRHGLVQDVDLLWVNDPALGIHCRSNRIPTVYDVTDDWRSAGFPSRIVRRIVRAEDRLAQRAQTIVCSPVLQQRWKTRYNITPPIVRNGIDLEAWTDVPTMELPGPGPHVGYVGTLHEHRLDLDLVTQLAGRPEIGTVHLVGPNCLGDPESRRLQSLPGLRIHGPVAAPTVPSWMKAMDVLVSPHLVNDFTLSLDAIKSYEYAASGQPVVATPTSGFQEMNLTRLRLASPQEFAAVTAKTVINAAAHPGDSSPASWADRTTEFWSVIERLTSKNRTSM